MLWLYTPLLINTHIAWLPRLRSRTTLQARCPPFFSQMLHSSVLIGVTFLLGRWCTTSPGLPMLQLHATPKATLALVIHISKGWTWKATNRLSPGPQCSVPPLKSNGVYFLNSLVTFGHSRLFSPHRIQLVKTDPPPIQHSRHNPQEELLHIVQQHQKLLSKRVHKSIEHAASYNMSFWWRL